MEKYVSITDLKQNTAGVVRDAQQSDQPIIIMRHSKPAAVILKPEIYEELIEALEDWEDIQAVQDWEAQSEPSIPAEQVYKELGLNPDQ